MDRIYFDHAATTPVDSEVLEKMIPYFREEFGNADSPHFFGRKAMNAVDSARDKVAELLNAKPSEIYFTSGGTEADNWALLSGAYAMRGQGRDRVIVSSIEHHAVLATAEKLEKEGFKITRLPVNEKGEVTTEALSAEIDEKTGLVAVMTANNETGVLQPITELCKLAKEFGALFFTDAVQYAPYAPIDVKALGVDMLSLSSHKFYGPKGCGVLYIRSGVKTQGVIVGGEQERGLRGGTTNVPSVVGLATALEKNTLGIKTNNEKIRALRELFLREISTLGGVFVNGDTDGSVPSVLNVRFEGVNNADFVYNMDLQGVSLAAGSACASASIKPSHVLVAMGLDDTQAKESVRFSFGKDNTEEEILRGAKLTRETVERLRGL